MKKIVIVIIVLVVLLTMLVSILGVLKIDIYPDKYNSYVLEYSKEYNLNPNFVRAIIKAESSYNHLAQSNMGAKGLMQITDSTGAWIAENLNIDDFNSNMLYNPQINIKFGCWYLNFLFKEFDDNNEAVIASYNAGQGNVKKWIDDGHMMINGKFKNVPFTETNNYIKRVTKYEKAYNFLYSKNDFLNMLNV